MLFHEVSPELRRYDQTIRADACRAAIKAGPSTWRQCRSYRKKGDILCVIHAALRDGTFPMRAERRAHRQRSYQGRNTPEFFYIHERFGSLR